jgi:hypothetical protein
MSEFNTDAFFDIIKSETPALYQAEVGPKIQTAEERREAWLRERLGKFTASEFHRLMANGKGADALSAGAKTYATEKAIELLTEPTFDNYVSAAMQWGLDHEAEAVSAWESRTGLPVEDHSHNQIFLPLGDSAGGTPDGLIRSESAGIEIKCPNSKTHLEYRAIHDAESLKSIAPDYCWQIQGLMLITGYERWFFVSYDPRFKNWKHRLHIASIAVNPTDIDRLVERLDKAIQYRDEIVSGLSH